MPYLFVSCHFGRRENPCFDRREKSVLDPSHSFGMTNPYLGHYERVSRGRRSRKRVGFVAPYQRINQLSWKKPFHPVQSAQTSPTQENLKHERSEERRV